MSRLLGERRRMLAWCMASSEPGGPRILMDFLDYDPQTLRPQPGPVIAAWRRMYDRPGCEFKVGFERKST